MNTYECEACGKKEELTEEEAYKSGWDYPPFLGVAGVVSPRTCGDCGIDKTLWWRLTTIPEYQATEDDLALIARINAETEGET